MALSAEQLDSEIASITEELTPLIEEYNAFVNEKKPAIDELILVKNRFEKQRQEIN